MTTKQVAFGECCAITAIAGLDILETIRCFWSSPECICCLRATIQRLMSTSTYMANDPNSRINKSLRAWKC